MFTVVSFLEQTVYKYCIILFIEFKASLRKFEHESNDLKFLNNQYVHKIRAMERESKEKSDHILRLQEKNFNAVIQTPGKYMCTVVIISYWYLQALAREQLCTMFT